MSQLLSMGSFVVSERCNPEDESNFHGIVEFPTGVSPDTMPERLKWFSELSVEHRLAKIHTIQAQYRTRFDPLHLLRQSTIALRCASGQSAEPELPCLSRDTEPALL